MGFVLKSLKDACIIGGGEDASFVSVHYRSKFRTDLGESLKEELDIFERNNKICIIHVSHDDRKATFSVITTCFISFSGFVYEFLIDLFE